MSARDAARSPPDNLVEKILEMLQMQADMNARVDADWRSRGREWYRAIWIECAELMDHYGGWKWWKIAPHARGTRILVWPAAVVVFRG